MRKVIYFIISISFILSFTKDVVAQGIRGAEVIKSIVANQNLTIRVNVYRAGESKDSILVSWGDGQEGVLYLGATSELSPGYIIDAYGGSHVYDNAGYVEIGVYDEFLVDDIINIEDSWQKGLVIRDSVYILPTGHPFDGNFGPEFSSLHSSINQNDEGTLSHSLLPFPNDVFNDSFHYVLVPFPVEDYTFPDASDSLYIDDYVFVWDRPLAPGVYAVCFKVREFRDDILDEVPGDFLLLSTTHRAMMIDIDSSMLVSSASPLFNNRVSLYPNPANQYVDIVYTNHQSSEQLILRAFDTAGKCILTKTMNNPSLEVNERIDVNGWAKGVYFFSISANNTTYSEVFIKQ